MNARRLLSSVALAAGLALGGGASAATITNSDGSFSPFGGFDWASSGAAWTDGYSGVVGTNFSLNFAAWAADVTDSSGQPFETMVNLDSTANGTPKSVGAYEYTIFATLTETVDSCNADFTVCSFTVTGGTFDIYYGSADAKISDGTGFLNGTKIISGTVNASGIPNQFSNATGGQATLTGLVTYTNNLFINPDLLGSTLTSTLQLASAVTNFVAPSGFDFDNNGSSDSLGDPLVIMFQADANQTFTSTVPEPSALALTALALLGAGAATRRRKSKG